MDKICILPADTENKPYELITTEDYDNLFIRVAEVALTVHDDTWNASFMNWKDNEGAIFYKITVEPPAKDASKDAKDEK